MRAVVATVAQTGPTAALTGYREPAAIARARALAGARRRRGFKPRAKRCLDGGDEIAVHSQEPLARPAAVNLIAALSRGVAFSAGGDGGSVVAPDASFKYCFFKDFKPMPLDLPSQGMRFDTSFLI